MNTTETTQEMCYNCGEFIYEDKHNCSLEETQPTEQQTKGKNMATLETTCADRIAQEMAEREEQIRQMVEQVEGSEYYGDEEAIYDLALSMTIEKVATICLSWGGPADYLEITYSDEITKMVYRFSDWFDTATLEVEEGSHLWNYGVMMLESMGE